MITVTDIDGNQCIVALQGVVVTEVTRGTSSRYRGVNSIIHAPGYKTLECKETVAQILKLIQAQRPMTGWPPGLLQDDCRGLANWLSEKPDALYQLRKLYKGE